jgi:glycosyltransferase involved in cell wall biosynthesis
MSRTSIALFYRFIGGGGAEKVLVNLARGFAERGLETDLVLCDASGPHMWQVSPQVRVVDLKAPRMIEAFPKLVQYLQREKPSAILSALHFSSEVTIGAKCLAGVPTRVVISEQNTLSLEVRHNPRLRYQLAPLAAKCFYPWVDGIVAASQGVARDLAQITNICLERIHIIYNPVITPEIFDMAKEPLAHPYFAPNQLPVILGAGRLQPQKDFPTLIQAFARVRKSHPSRLVILGWGEDLQQLKALACELGVDNEVDFAGHVKNPFNYMAQSAVFVLSSAWEGFGNVLAEALALGTPVVSTNCESGPAEILDKGKYGWLTPVGDSEALANAILEVLAGKRKKFDPTWLDRFSLETVTQQYLDVCGLSV